MKVLIISVAIFISQFSIATASLPDWVARASKSQAIDTFFSEMKRTDQFYQVTNVLVEEKKWESGQDGVLVTILFDDAKGCNERWLKSMCAPIKSSDRKIILCVNFLTDCNGDEMEIF